MRQAIPKGAAATFAYGSVLINTMPIWLAALASKSGTSETTPGLLASVVLVAAALGCGSALKTLNNRILISAFLVAALPVSAVLTSAVAPPALLVAGAVFGLAFGVLLRVALRSLLSIDDPTRAVGDTLAAAVLASLAVLLVVSIYPDAILPILAALGVIPAAIAVSWRKPIETAGPSRDALRPDRHSLGFLAFFIAMGAYWSFLEVHADRHGLASISGWLFGGLLASAAGSALASRLPVGRRPQVLLLSMLAAAASGFATYATGQHWLIGASILANGFFLFLFFSLYLGGAGTGAAGSRMAVYLAGFALGGAVGAMTIALGGFTALALAILLSGFIALPAGLSSRGVPSA